MGNKTVSDAKYGKIQIWTEKNQYIAGEQVNGSVNMNLIQNFPSTQLYLIIEGKEKAKVVYSYRRTNIQGKRRTRYSTSKEKKEFYEHSFPIFTITDRNYFPMGQYSFRFSFVLGEHLPGSFEKRWHEHGYEAYGKIKYKLKAGLKAASGDSKLFGKKTIIIDEKYNPGKMNAESPLHDKEVKGYCYTSHGRYKMAAIFSNNRFIVGDQAIMSMAVDASDASTDLKNIKCELVMITSLKANGHSGSNQHVVNRVDLGQLEAGSKLVDENALSVQLEILTPGEMQASASGNIVKNQFYLQFVGEVDGCVCYDEHPNNRIHIGVYNKHFANPSPPGNMMTGGNMPWNPQQMPPYIAQVNDQQFRMNDEFRRAYKPMLQED